jgi:uncharacterized protein YbbC (DUF1343 family)
MPVTLGSERLLASKTLQGKRIGLVCNPASANGEFHHIADLMAASHRFALAAIFGPQHGFHADVQDNMIESAHARHSRFDIPIYSLYSETREPTPAMLEGIDALVVDLQEVGVRIYTFIATMAACLRAARRHDIPIVVCDRPNPIGGVTVEGPMLFREFESFVGPLPIPMRHGMTMGELAWLFNEHFEIGASLTIAPMESWERRMYWADTGLPWLMPSPNMPTADTAVVYPGMVLLEGTNASEGRGTTRPFEIVGAPWVNGEKLARELNKSRLEGVHFRPLTFQPTFQKYAGQRCGGCQIHVQTPQHFSPMETAAYMLSALRHVGPRAFDWREPPYEYETERMPIDILAGSDRLRRHINDDLDPRYIIEEWEEEIQPFLRVRERYLLY